MEGGEIILKNNKDRAGKQDLKENVGKEQTLVTITSRADRLMLRFRNRAK